MVVVLILIGACAGILRYVINFLFLSQITIFLWSWRLLTMLSRLSLRLLFGNRSRREPLAVLHQGLRPFIESISIFLLQNSFKLVSIPFPTRFSMKFHHNSETHQRLSHTLKGGLA